VVDVTGLVIRRQGADASQLLSAINALGVAAATVALFELVSVLARVRVGRPTRGFQGLLLLFSPLQVMLPPMFKGLLLSACMAVLVWAMWRGFRAARGGDHDSAVVARGFMVLNLCLLGDILGKMNVLPLPRGLPILGFIVLFLSSARSLNERFGREEEASRTDALTGLPNRRGFLEAGEDVLELGRLSGRPVSVVLADLDRFKEVNDSMGHAAGDLLLRSVAAAVRESIRARDIAARWGGDEIVILLPDTDGEGALHVAEDLRASVARLAVSHGGARLGATLSLGVAGHVHGTSLGATLVRADAALYRAKEEGRNRVAAE